MRVAMLSHLASRAAPTGAERSLALLAVGLSANGHEIAVATPGPWALSEELEAGGAKVTTVPVRQCWLVQYGPQPPWRQAARGLRYAWPDPGSRGLRTWLSEFEPDVVHVNCLSHLRGAAAARSLGLPVVWHLREILPPGPRRRWFAGRLRTDATRIVAVSEAVAGWVREEGLGDRVEVVYNGVDRPTVDFDRLALRDRFGLPPKAVAVGLFSQLVVHKGALDLARAAHTAFAENSDLHFLIAGHGPDSFADELEREIAAGPAAGCIHVVPPQADIWELLAAVDVLALPTLWPDPLPRAIMEAMAAGRPAVAYESGGVPEMVINGETGLLCRPGDVQALARAILEMAGDDRLRNRCGEAGRKRARDFFSVALHIERMETVLEAVTSVRS
ncbi:MAG: glycosyltransferase family 4 protein [Thermoanaerobaculales bacterium]|nr:glycosyltransferase family 4 protein [Thermoanaerobaculales bacterium]